MASHLHIYFSPIESESRIMRATAAISKKHQDDNIFICGIWKKGLPETEEINDRIRIIRLRISPRGIRGFRSYLLRKDWKNAIIKRWIGENITIVHCHSLFDLYAATELKKKKNCRLVYDAHELETERNGLRGLYKIIEKRRERKLIRNANHTIVVNDSIASWYKSKYPGSPISVVKNIARNHTANETGVDKNFLIDTYKISSDAIVFIYLGYLYKGRGIETILKVFSSGTKHHVVFVGYGPFEKVVKEYSDTNKNIHFHDKVPESQVIATAASADVGLSLIENTCLSYYYCLPNKIYEYLYAGIPVLCSNFPEMQNVILKHNAGWAINPEFNDLKSFVDSIDRTTVENTKQRITGIKTGSWADEEKKLLDVYDRLIEK